MNERTDKSNENDKFNSFKQKMSREDFIFFVKKRKECNSRAQKIVEQLLDTTTEEVFLNVVKFLNQAYLDDLFEERFILKICGYPLCDNQLLSIPKHKYKISTAVNKVYDITNRKKFCSAQCFSASKYIREQLPTSPLWVLENEEERNYKLWNRTKNSLDGDEVNFKYDNIKRKEIDRRYDIEEGKFKTIHLPLVDKTDNASESNIRETEIISPLDDLNNISDALYAIKIQKKKQSDFFNKPNKMYLISSSINDRSLQKDSGDMVINKYLADQMDIKTNETVKYNSKEVNVKNNILKNLTMLKKPIPLIDIIKNTLYAWITMDALIILFGEEHIKKICMNIGHELKISTGNILTPNQMEQYTKLCKRINLIEIQEQKVNKCENLQPLPEYRSLKEENHKLMIKVRAFYEGKTDIPADEVNSTENSITKEDDVNEKIFLPLTDQYDQKVKRREIVLSFLEPIINKLLQDFEINENVPNELRQLIDTFELDAKNIIFKPALQKLIALFVLKLISMMPGINNKLNKIFSLKLFEQILNVYNISLDEFNSIIINLTNVENVIKSKNK